MTLSVVLALGSVQSTAGQAKAADGDVPQAQEQEQMALSLPLELFDYHTIPQFL